MRELSGVSETARDLAMSRLRLIQPYLEQKQSLQLVASDAKICFRAASGGSSSGRDRRRRSSTGQPRDWARMTPDTTNNSETLRQIAVKATLRSLKQSASAHPRCRFSFSCRIDLLMA